MQNGSVSAKPRSGYSAMDQLPIAVDEHLYKLPKFWANSWIEQSKSRHLERTQSTGIGSRRKTKIPRS